MMVKVFITISPPTVSSLPLVLSHMHLLGRTQKPELNRTELNLT